MIEPPQLAETATQHTAVIHFRIPREEMPQVMGAGVDELLSTLATQGIVPAGPLFTHHFKMEPGLFDFDLGWPVATPVEDAGRVRASQLLATKVARTVYHGPYEGLPAAWGEFMDWIVAQGHKPAANLWECYVVGPADGSDASNWRTQLNRPLAD